jgi:EmrB/QacA subfamily drug resistance transporter
VTTRANGTIHPAVELEGRARLEVVFAIMLALFLGALDQTVVGVALPTIIGQLGGADLYTWTVTAYLLTSTVTIPIYGKLSDLYGRKPMLLIGITIFLTGSALSGLSQNMTELILFRAIQGLGAGSLFPIALAVIGDLFTPAERGKYQGLFGAVFGIAAIIGPALGGFLTENVSWHWIFYINIPIGLVSMFVIARILPVHRRAGATRDIDYLGVAVFTAAVVPLLIGLTNAQTNDWLSVPVGGLIAIAAALVALFVWVEAHAKEPIVPLTLFRNRSFSLSVVATMFASFGFFGSIVFLPLWLQRVEGFTPTQSGWAIFPLLFGLIIGSTGSGLITSRTGRYKWLITGALAIMSVGILLMTGLHADTAFVPTLASWMFLTGLGIGPTFAVFTIVVQNAVPFDKLGVATSNLTFFRQIGGSVGLALIGSIFGTTLRQQVPVQLLAAGVPKPFVDQFAAQGASVQALERSGNLAITLQQTLPPEAQAFIPGIVHAVNESLSLGIAAGLWIGLGAVLLALASSLFLPELPLRRTTQAQELALAAETGFAIPDEELPART